MNRGPSGIFDVDRSSGESVRAFVPNPLPPAPPIAMAGALAALHDRALLACGRLDGVSAVLPDPDLFLYAYVRREALLSSQIEGTQSSLSDLLLFEIDEAPGVPLDDVVEVSSYVAALEHCIGRLRGGFPLSGRLLIALVLTASGVLAQPLLYVSLYLKHQRDEYYRLLDIVRQEGNWEAWLRFFLEGVAVTAQGSVDTAHRLLVIFRDDTARVEGLRRAAATALRVYDAFRRRPLMTIPALTTATGASFPTVARAIESLVSLGIVNEITGRKRERVFAYQKYLDVLNEGTEPL